MIKALAVVALLGLHLYVLLDVLRTPATAVRALPRWLWCLVVLVPVLGPLCWLVLGRPGRASGGDTGGRPRGGAPAPDDDTAFLKRLDEQSWAARMQRLRDEQEGEGPEPPG
jgi:hypothetical protein